MSDSKTAIVVALIFSFVLGFAATANADLDQELVSSPQLARPDTEPTLEHLLENDRVRVRSWVQADGDTVVGQQLELNIEVASNSWFSGGTRIGRFELDDAIVLRRNKFAVNSSRREAGETWSVQLWTITLYPQRAGSFTLPAIEVHVSVANPENPTAAISGVVQTGILQFNALLPEATQARNIKHWIASNDYTVSDEFDKPIDSESGSQALSTGDALRRTITLRAENVAAMMLPAINVSSVPGLATYMRPARLEDRVNRGTYLAVRREVISYVAEQEGLYTLPEITLHWWNTQTLSLEQIVLPAHQLRVGRSAAGRKSFASGSIARTVAPYFIAALAMATFIFLCLKSARIQSVWHTIKSLLYPESQQLKRKLIRSYPGSEPAAHAIKTLQWLEYSDLGSAQSIRTFLSGHANPKLSPLFDRMMQHAFGNKDEPLSREEFGFLIDELDRSLYGAERDSKRIEPYLNPRHS